MLVLTGKRLLSAPAVNSLAEMGSAAATAAIGHSSEASLSDFPSPASSAAEALELEAVTFGQDATDLLDEHSSASGFS